MHTSLSKITIFLSKKYKGKKKTIIYLLKEYLPLALKAAKTQVINLLGIDWSVTVGSIAHKSFDGWCLHNCSDTSGLNVWKYCIASFNKN